ncbi:hypothetical protein RJT34_17682 [Clitoria ternatea]|uniref:Protein SCAR n=1 Tax=Clitoria ternatea TaxID=43366 RepID=A0AAN9PDZ2_CLITE
MPLCRYHIRSTHALADPELHRAADKDDSEALLEAVAMAGLVGFLRQLGDLAQFAAEMFHDLHEDVMATAARSHRLISRVQQLEAEVPALEKAFLSQTHHASYFRNGGGIEWHPNLRSEQNLVARGDLPRFMMDSYEECRGPPRLFLLDKFDVAGAGACLKRYTDPSFFKVESVSSGTATVVHREKRIRKVKQKKGGRRRNGETPDIVPSHGKLHQLLLEERIENACSDPARLVKLKKKQLNGSAVEAKTGKSYMEKILEIPSPDRKMVCEEIPSPDHKMVCETSIIPQPVKLVSDSDNTCDSRIKILEISSVTPMKRSLGNENTCSSPNKQELELNPYSEMDRETNGYIVKMHEQISGVTDEMPSNNLKVLHEAELVFDEQRRRECSLVSYQSDDVTSEVDDYMDALATMESEFESDNECGSKKSLLKIQNLTDSNGKGEPQLQARFSYSKSFGNSSTSEEISSLGHDRNAEHNEVQLQDQLSDSLSTGTSCASDDDISFRRKQNEEHPQLQAQFSDSQSIGDSTSEIDDMPSNQLPTTCELQRTYWGEFVTDDDAHVQGEVISDSRPVSYGSCLMDSEHLVLSSDLGATSPASIHVGGESDEATCGLVEHHLRTRDDEHMKCLVESIAARPAALSPVKDKGCLMVSFDNNSLNNLDVSDTYVHSNVRLQVSNDFITREGEYGDHSEIEILQAESLNEYSSEILVRGDVGLQWEDPICPSTKTDLNPGMFDGREKSEDAVIATKLNSEDLFPVAETIPKSSFTEELCLDFTHKNGLDLNQQANLEEVARILPGEEIHGSTYSLDPAEDDEHIEHPSSDIISSPLSSLTKLEESISILEDPCEKEMIVNEADCRESLTELAAQKVVDPPEIASTNSQLNLNRSVPCDPSDSGMYNNIHHPSPKEKTKYDSSINDLKMVPACSEPDMQRSESLFVRQDNEQNIKDGQLKPQTHSDLFEKFRPQQIQIPNQWEQERISHAASEIAAEFHLDEPSCDFSTQSSGQVINPTKRVMDPFKPLITDLLPKSTKINLKEMPPMPPLPPMQWRVGKAQHTSLVTQREDTELSLASSQQIQQNKPDDNKSQYGLSTSEKTTLLFQNPFLPVITVESNMHHHSSGFSAGISEHLVARSQIQNPLTLQDGPPVGHVASKEEMVFNSSPCPPPMPAECALSGAESIFQDEGPTSSSSQLEEVIGLEVKKDRPEELHLVLPAEYPVSRDDPISPKEKPTQSPCQLMEETSLEAKTTKQSSINPQRERGDSSISPVSPPSIETEQTNHSMALSDGEMVFSLDTSAPMSKFDSEMPKGKPKKKLPLPETPEIDPLAALDKSRLRKVTERVMSQRAQKEDERDSLLEQIRSKSFNLRPALVKRPSIQGPKTNLRVAAILEKANAIRQALAGSDEDDDADSWSDS